MTFEIYLNFLLTIFLFGIGAAAGAFFFRWHFLDVIGGFKSWEPYYSFIGFLALCC